MKRKISIATLALTASTSFAFLDPNMGEFNSKTYCLNIYADEGGAMSVGTCDESENNLQLGLALNSQGCTEGQAAMHVTKRKSSRHFSPNIKSCLPPNVVQL